MRYFTALKKQTFGDNKKYNYFENFNIKLFFVTRSFVWFSMFKI